MAHILYVAALSALLASSATHASPTLGEQVATRIAALPQPSASMSGFAKWVHNTSLFTGGACWKKYGTGGPEPAVLRGPILSAGTFIAIDDKNLETVCQDIANKGIAPVCTHSTLLTSPRSPDRSLSREYLQFDHGDTKLAVSGVLGCYLTPTQLNRQVFAGPLEARWSQSPREQSFQTVTGARILTAGTVQITAEGVPGLQRPDRYVEYRTGVLP